jgi:glycosyltransferase involved in cell wall biosynthesis
VSLPYNRVSSMSNPRFSIVIPTLNEEKFLPKLLTSLASQTVKNFDVVVVDGHSADKTVVVAKRYKKTLPQLTIVECETAGVSRQRNIGAKTGKADWLVFVDADSVLLSNFVERIGMYIDKKHPKFFTTWLKTDSDDPSDAIVGLIFNMCIEGSIVIERPWAPGPLTVVRRDIFEMAGGYEETTTFGEDHDFSMSIFEKGIPFTILREVLYIYSLRRYRREGNLKALERYLKSTLAVTLTKRGPKHMKGFESGGSMYGDTEKKKKKIRILPKEFEKSLKKFIQEFAA